MTSDKKQSKDGRLNIPDKKVGEMLLTEELQLSELTDTEESIVYKLNRLPAVKARPGFDQRMAAAFALETLKERQIHNRNVQNFKRVHLLFNMFTNTLNN